MDGYYPKRRNRSEARCEKGAKEGRSQGAAGEEGHTLLFEAWALGGEKARQAPRG